MYTCVSIMLFGVAGKQTTESAIDKQNIHIDMLYRKKVTTINKQASAVAGGQKGHPGHLRGTQGHPEPLRAPVGCLS